MATLPNRWEWRGQGDAAPYVELCAGRSSVMSFRRWGMRGAQPAFYTNQLQDDAADLLMFQVGNPDVRGMKQARQDRSVYRYNISGIDHPTARLIQSANVMLAALQVVADRIADPEAAALVREAIAGATESPGASNMKG